MQYVGPTYIPNITNAVMSVTVTEPFDKTSKLSTMIVYYHCAKTDESLVSPHITNLQHFMSKY